MLIGVSDWRLDLGEKFPKLEYLQIYADEFLEDFDNDCWYQLSHLMNRSIWYNCSLGESFNQLYEDVLTYVKIDNLDPTPLIRWLAVGQMYGEDNPLVDFAGLNSFDLITALSCITDMRDLNLRIRLDPSSVDQVFHLIPKSVKCLIFISGNRVSPILFLEFFRSFSNVEVIKLFLNIDEDNRVIWPAGYFTNASVFSNYSLRHLGRRFVRAHYIRDRLPRWAIHGDQKSLAEQSIDSSQANFTNLNEEIMHWFEMKKSLRYVEMLCMINF